VKIVRKNECVAASCTATVSSSGRGRSKAASRPACGALTFVEDGNKDDIEYAGARLINFRKRCMEHVSQRVLCT